VPGYGLAAHTPGLSDAMSGICPPYAPLFYFSPQMYTSPKAIHLFYDAKISYFSIFYEMIFIMTKRFSYIIEFEWSFQTGVL
jgi:hypothetical protein